MSESRQGIGWQRWLLLVLFAGIAIAVVTRFAKAETLIATLGRGDPWWIGIGLGIHILYFLASAQLYVLGFSMVDVEARVWHMLSLLLAGFFVNAAVPTGGAGTAALFVDDAERRGQSGARAAVGTILVLLADLGTLFPFLAYGIWFLYVTGQGKTYVFAGSALYSFFVVSLTGALVLTRRKPAWLRWAMTRIRQAANHVGGWFGRDDLLGVDWVQGTVEDLSGAAGAIVARPWKLLLMLGWAVFMHAINVAGLYAFFVAYRQSIPVPALVAGWALGIVFYVVTIIPHVIAAVEGIMLLAFTSEGIPAENAAAVIVVFRGVSFWLPVILGFVSLRNVPTFRSRKD